MKEKSFEAKIRYDSSAVLYMLVILEREPVIRSILTAQLAQMGINYTERHISRRLQEAESLGFKFQRNGNEIVLEKTNGFSVVLLTLLARWLSESAALKSCILGTIDPERVAHHLENQNVLFLHNLVKSASESRLIEFDYKPQTEETAQKIKESRNKMNHVKWNDKGAEYIKVQMLPHYLVFSGSDFLVLGETFFSKTDIRKRQYLVAGISNLMIKELSTKTITIDTEELYQYSLSVWISGTLYDLEIEEKQPAGEYTRNRITVNGEVEILSYAASKLGSLKILNPPPALIEKARKTPGLCDMIFYQKDI